MAYAKYIKNFGMDNFLDDPNSKLFRALIAYVAENGKPFKGYKGTYFYNSLGYAEFIMHCLPAPGKKQLEMVGFSTHSMNDNFWTLRVEHALKDVDDDALSMTCLFKHAEHGNGLLPIQLVHADVIPSYLQDDLVTVQVSGFPEQVEYFSDEEEYFKQGPDMGSIKGDKIHLSEGVFLAAGLLTRHIVTNNDSQEENETDGDADAMVLVWAHVKDVITRPFMKEATVDKYLSVVVETEFGTFEFQHTLDMVTKEQQKFIKPGCVVSFLGIVSGDVAIEHYQQGAAFTEEDELRLLRYCFATKDFIRLQAALTKECSCQFEDNCVRGIAKVLTVLQAISEKQVPESKTKFAVVTKADAMHEIGTRCITVTLPNLDDEIKECFFLTRNAENMITHIEITEASTFLFKEDKPFVNSDPDAIDVKNIVFIPRGEYEWLQVLRDCYAQNDFSSDIFYFGLAKDCLYINNQEIKGQDTIYNYLQAKMQEFKEQGVQSRSKNWAGLRRCSPYIWTISAFYRPITG
jgi:hypothetical protein